MRQVRKTLIRNGMRSILRMQAFFFRHTATHWLGRAFNALFATTTIRAKGIREVQDLESLGRSWQKGFPSPKQVPITGIDNNTLFAEIRTPCPLRGTGDTHACYRMMGYDRHILKKAGGQFVVLESQAEPDVTVCKVAMRMKADDMDDLTPAHQRE